MKTSLGHSAHGDEKQDRKDDGEAKDVEQEEEVKGEEEPTKWGKFFRGTKCLVCGSAFFGCIVVQIIISVYKWKTGLPQWQKLGFDNVAVNDGYAAVTEFLCRATTVTLLWVFFFNLVYPLCHGEVCPFIKKAFEMDRLCATVSALVLSLVGAGIIIYIISVLIGDLPLILMGFAWFFELMCLAIMTSAVVAVIFDFYVALITCERYRSFQNFLRCVDNLNDHSITGFEGHEELDDGSDGGPKHELNFERHHEDKGPWLRHAYTCGIWLIVVIAGIFLVLTSWRKVALIR